jgi:hypothetical protein
MFYIFSGNTGGPVALIGYARGAEGYARQEAKRLMGFYVHENHLTPEQAKQVRKMHERSFGQAGLGEPGDHCLCPVCTQES